MRHAVLGAGGVGGLVGGALARAGRDVVLLMRPETLERYGGRLSVESAVLGDFTVDVPAAPELDRDVDVLWVTPKATQLDAALALAPPERVGTAIPLLNGVDHVALLRARYSEVMAAAIRVESERVSPDRIHQASPFLIVDLAGAEPVGAELEAAGFTVRQRDDERTLLWDKLAVLGPIALATTGLDSSYGGVRADERYLRCQDEAIAVARADGAAIDERALRTMLTKVPDEMRSSMQKDVDAGHPPELDAIAGPILRGGERHGIPVPATHELAGLVTART